MSFAASRVAHAIRRQNNLGGLASRGWNSRPAAAAAATSTRSYASAKTNKPAPAGSARPAASKGSSSSSPSPSDAVKAGAMTSAAELHPLPDSVKDAGKSSTGAQEPQYDEKGNSTSAVDHSSRPAGPGPSSPPVDPSVAAPRTTSTGENGGGGSSSGKAQYSTSATARAASEESPPLPTMAGSDWATSFSGMSTVPFPKELSEILEAPINEDDIEIKPDGLLYLPEIKYRRILNRAFGPGGWGLAPRTETNVTDKIVSREWALICLGRFVSTARGEQEYFDPSGVATASEGAKSNALMRCCKDLGIAHELWSPRFIRGFKERKCVEVFVEHATTKKKKKLWRRKDVPAFDYPWKEGR